jgi:hypothetical protein
MKIIFISALAYHDVSSRGVKIKVVTRACPDCRYEDQFRLRAPCKETGCR